MGWLYLFIASIFEIGWPLGLKLATTSSYKLLWIIFAIITMALSGIFLYLAQKIIPIGTAYAIWTGIGATCTFAIGILLFNDSFDMIKLLGVMLIILGIILLKVAH